MSIPDFQSIMQPLLRHTADGKEHSNRGITQALAEHFQLSREDLNRLLPSGREKVFTNRVAWARDYATSIESNIVLLGGRELAELLIDYGVGVSTTNVYEIKRMDYDYFEEA